MNNIIVRLADLDPRVRGFVRPDSNGDYNIYINCNLCIEMQKQTLRHELEHIRRNHIYSDRLVKQLEAEVEGGTL